MVKYADICNMSEELLQIIPQKIGKYEYYRIGQTTLGQLKQAGLIPKKDYGELERKKPDGIVLYHKQVKAIVESKLPSELDTEKKVEKAINQEIEVSKALCKLLIVTDNNSKTIWVNAFNGERILGRKDNEIKTLFDSKLAKNVNELEHLIEEIDKSISKNNSKLKEDTIVDPSLLAKRIWQTIFVATQEHPLKCLYNVIELFIFKFLSDLKVLEEDYSFIKVFEKSKTNHTDALEYYVNNTRKKMYEKFPVGDDSTTIINGTIFVKEDGTADTSQSILFKMSLRHLDDFGKEFGSLTRIDKNFKTKLYETFLIQDLKKLGQYFTPRKIVQSIIRISKLDEQSFQFEGKRICDPFCGVGGFPLEILNMNEKIKEKYIPENGKINTGFVLHGFDKGSQKDDERTIIMAKANMLIYLSDIVFNNPTLTEEFSKLFNNTFRLFQNNLGTFGYLLKEEEKYDFILTNPPYVTSGSKIIKDEIAENIETKKFYSVNEMGLESLSVEWIIKSLKPNGKAFILLPNGIFDRKTKKLRDFIIEQCFLDALISLPVKTFFSNQRKTYILAVTKKQNIEDEQEFGVFSYIVSNIGEKLTSVFREDIEENDLPELENLFALFSSTKNENITDIINSKRCKIFPIKKFKDSKYWIIEDWWDSQVKKELGLEKERISYEESKIILENSIQMLGEIKEEYSGIEVEENEINNFEYQELPLKRIFKIVKGNSKYTKDYIKRNRGEYPVYSSQTTDKGIFGYISTYDYEGNCLTWTTDGINAGTLFLRQDDKFTMTTHCGALFSRAGKLDLSYVYYFLKRILKQYAVSDQNKRVIVDTIGEIMIKIPIKAKGEWDVAKQKEIAETYKIFDDRTQKLNFMKKEIVDNINKTIIK